jgi:CDGSH-type Zn-finger protein
MLCLFNVKLQAYRTEYEQDDDLMHVIDQRSKCRCVASSNVGFCIAKGRHSAVKTSQPLTAIEYQARADIFALRHQQYE